MNIENLLNTFKDIDKICLTASITGIEISEDEFNKALEVNVKQGKEYLLERYNENKDKFNNLPDFETLYNEIYQECLDFYNEENKKKYIEKTFTDEYVNLLLKFGSDEKRINNLKENFFHCSFIADTVGKSTKYGKNDNGFFYHFYHSIGMDIDRLNDIRKYININGNSPLSKVPDELKSSLISYEVSYFNYVTLSSILMINYYFKYTDEVKNYLLKYVTDYNLNELQDLTLYKGDEVKYYSCTHEQFCSLDEE